MDEHDPDQAAGPTRSALSRKSSRTPVFVGFLVVLGLVAAWLWRRPTLPPLEPPRVALVDAGDPPAARRGPTVDAAQGESLLHRRLEGLSDSAEWKRWLAEKNLLGRFVAAVDLVASGESPRPLLSFLAPTEPFTVEGDAGALHASVASFARYDRVTQAVTGLDADKLAAAYGELAPYLRAAFQEIAPPGASFDARLHAALGKLTSTPLPDGTPVLLDGDHGYVYADPALEALSPAQKHLLRLGPTNAHALVRWLTALEHALPAP